MNEIKTAPRAQAADGKTAQGVDFTFADTIGGYVTAVDADKNGFRLKTADGREFRVELTSTTSAELVRNLGEPYHDATGAMGEMLVPGRFLHAYGVFYPEGGTLKFEAKLLVFQGRGADEYLFEKPDWWVRQISELGNFYRRAEFGEGEADFREYSTVLDASGHKMADNRQETDTVSRLVYGFASAYLLTGDEKFLDVAENGTDYLRDNFRTVDSQNGTCYWYHALEFKKGRMTKVLASEFGDDINAIPAYEQIYALSGPVQTYRVTGDPEIIRDARMTINMLDKYFLDKSEKGGYFSHIDPVTFSPHAECLGGNRARKNWNSVGDHAPAYLINLYLATGDEAYARMLETTFDTIVRRFPDYENSPFVQEKFFEDWGRDQSWGWQQNRAVVGHNLKIAWNMMRMHSLRPKKEYLELAEKIAALMPKAGMDPQRGGWYDVVERTVRPGERFHRFAWHDRKAWWQQEQGILAYLILNGVLKKPEYLKLARESSAFYNAWFLDNDAGGIYFNVLANGIPYLMGTERKKGSHSMAAYHSFELCYLASVYTNLLITKQPMDFYFKPKPGGFNDRVLRVQPDLLPPGSVVISKVEIDGKDYKNFDAKGLTVQLPDSTLEIRVKATLRPS
jgi:mannose/cellobiose epimerase-like protein (N-acyl-D-glucosamine 2-epimerase family)